MQSNGETNLVERIRFRHRLEYTGVTALGLLARRLPLNAALWLGDRVGDFVFSVLRTRQQVVLQNLHASFPEWPHSLIVRTARQNYRQFGRLAVEYLRLPGLPPEQIENYVEIVNRAMLDTTLAEGRGAVFVSAHFGNWEYMGAALAMAGLPMWYLYQEQANPLVSALITRHRKHMHMRTIPRGVAVRRVLRALRAGECVAFLADQDAGREGIFLDFLGRPASFARGPAVFALKTGAPVIFAAAVRSHGGRHRAFFERLDVTMEGGVTEENIRKIVTAYARRMETFIRRHPDHWFWMHRRWKTQPLDHAAAETVEVAA